MTDHLFKHTTHYRGDGVKLCVNCMKPLVRHNQVSDLVPSDRIYDKNVAKKSSIRSKLEGKI